MREATVGDVAQVSATLADAFANLELPPGRWEMTVPLSGAIAFVRALGPRLPRARRLQRLFERVHLEEPHYYVRYLGVADRCDSEGVPAYLEASTERSAALYERLGFVHLGELSVANGPRFWPMRRPPAAVYVTPSAS